MEKIHASAGVLAVPFKEGCRRLGFEVTTGYEMIKEKKLETFLVGKRRFVTVASMQAFLAARLAESREEQTEHRAEKVAKAVAGRAKQRAAAP